MKFFSGNGRRERRHKPKVEVSSIHKVIQKERLDYIKYDWRWNQDENFSHSKERKG